MNTYRTRWITVTAALISLLYSSLQMASVKLEDFDNSYKVSYICRYAFLPQNVFEQTEQEYSNLKDLFVYCYSWMEQRTTQYFVLDQELDNVTVLDCKNYLNHHEHESPVIKELFQHAQDENMSLKDFLIYVTQHALANENDKSFLLSLFQKSELSAEQLQKMENAIAEFLRECRATNKIDIVKFLLKGILFRATFLFERGDGIPTDYSFSPKKTKDGYIEWLAKRALANFCNNTKKIGTATLMTAAFFYQAGAAAAKSMAMLLHTPGHNKTCPFNAYDNCIFTDTRGNVVSWPKEGGSSVYASTPFGFKKNDLCHVRANPDGVVMYRPDAHHTAFTSDYVEGFKVALVSDADQIINSAALYATITGLTLTFTGLVATGIYAKLQHNKVVDLERTLDFKFDGRAPVTAVFQPPVSHPSASHPSAPMFQPVATNECPPYSPSQGYKR